MKDDVKGFGLIAGLEYMKQQNHFFSIELRTKYGYYSFDDGTKWYENENGVIVPPDNTNPPRLEYSLFSPQIGIVPKFHYWIDDDISLFIENEVSVGLMTGKFKYGGNPYLSTNFTESIISYNIGLGVEYKAGNKWSLIGSVGYSTLNFRKKIIKHQPQNYVGWIPNQNAGLIVNIILKIPL